MIADNLAFIRENKKMAVITPRTNAPSLSIFEQDVMAVLSEETHHLVDGICVPKVDTKEDMQQVDDILLRLESNYGLPFHTFKVIPQIESTLSFVNMKDIFTFGKPRIIAAAFGGDDFTADFGVPRSDDDRELHFAR